MHREVNAISSRLSLRPPQRQALEILDRVTEIAPPKKEIDLAAALDAIRAEYPKVTEFERDFPSLCFALATGVGKTRLMGAFISYLHLAHGVDNFFVLAPNLTIYNKLIADFTPGSPKYVFPGIADFATTPPEIITGDNFESRAGTLFDRLIRCKVNIFNISKINTEVRGGKSPRIKRLSEYLGESYFEYLASLPDLVLLMDESHRYRASAGVRAINELKPILGLELTATPFVTTGQSIAPFKNVVLDYPLRLAMDDGFVKEPVVVTRENFNPDSMSAEELERLKLEDGVRLHEQTKVELETYARENNAAFVKPFILVIARDTTHASELLELIKQDDFFDGRYAEKVIQVDSSSGTGTERDDIIEKLLQVERYDSPIEIVIHVNMLKEGWDVTNLYTIVPLRAANARVLIEQTIGRGLRLPYGKRTGVKPVDRLSIVAHDKFQEIVDEANRSDSPIQLKSLVLNADQLNQHQQTIVAPSLLDTSFGISPEGQTSSTVVAAGSTEPVFATPAEQAVAQLTYDAIKKLQRDPVAVPDLYALDKPAIQERLIREVEATYNAGQLKLGGVAAAVDFASVVKRSTSLVIGQTISIPRIIVVPKGEVRSGFRAFELDVRALNYSPIEETLYLQELRTGLRELVGIRADGGHESRLEDYIVSGLIDFDDVSYDATSELLYDLASQAVNHFRAYLEEDDVKLVLRQNQRAIAQFIHSQMQAHSWEEAAEYETVVHGGFSTISPKAFTHSGELTDFRVSPADKSKMGNYVFNGFQRGLRSVEKFHSDTERLLAVILDRDSIKWFRPSASDFRISYRHNHQFADYLPDFVAELNDRIVILEPKMRSAMNDGDVIAKKSAAIEWCTRASEYARLHHSKPWSYALIPHDAIAVNYTLPAILQQFTVTT
jgi:type III restriction enzyme